MNWRNFTVLDEKRQPLSPAAGVVGRLTLASQPKPWEAPSNPESNDWPDHWLLVAADETAVKQFRYVEDEDGRLYRVQRSKGGTLTPGQTVWGLRREVNR